MTASAASTTPVALALIVVMSDNVVKEGDERDSVGMIVERARLRLVTVTHQEAWRRSGEGALGRQRTTVDCPLAPSNLR